MYGKHLNETTKQKLKERFGGKNNPNYGKPMSEEQKQKISQTKKDTYLKENHPMYGKHHTEETKIKISESHKGLQLGANNPNSKQIVQCNKDLSIIQIWSYIKFASNQLNIQRTDISSCCSMRLKTAGGFVWRYIYDQIRKDGTIIPGAITLGLITEEEALRMLKEQDNIKGGN